MSPLLWLNDSGLAAKERLFSDDVDSEFCVSAALKNVNKSLLHCVSTHLGLGLSSYMPPGKLRPNPNPDLLCSLGFSPLCK